MTHDTAHTFSLWRMYDDHYRHGLGSRQRSMHMVISLVMHGMRVNNEVSDV